MAAVLVVSPRTPAQRDRGGIDENAIQLVLNAYREACRSGSQTPFDAALERYLAKFPHISKDLAGYTVAHILATAGF